MEHEAEKLIREKIAFAENLSANWSKDRVWNLIDLPHPKRSYRTAYYAAAAFMIATFTTVVILENNEPRGVDTRVQELEAMIAKANASAAPGWSPAVVPEGPCQSAVAASNSATIKAEYPVNKKIAEQEVTPIMIVNEENVVPVQKQPEIVTLTETTTPSQPIVLAIMGVVPPQPTQKIATTRTRKIKLQLFKSTPPEVTTLLSEESKILTARIN